MENSIVMQAELSTEPEQIPIKIGDRSITLLKYLPNTNYYDIKSKFSKDVSDEAIQLLDSNRENDEVRGVIFFAPAMAAKQYFYKYFLDYLSSSGFLVISLDFTDIGLSSSGPLKGSTTDFEDWIEDLEVSTDWFLQNYKEILLDHGVGSDLIDKLPKYYYCHSLGGQMFGFLSTQNEFTKMVAITSQNGYWRLYMNKWRYFFFWYFLPKPLIKLFGYFPGKKLGLDDLPAKVMLKWKKWCTSENYFFDDPDYDHQHSLYKHNILTVGFTDDPWATEAAITDFYNHYENSTKLHWFFSPKDFDLKEIGHFGYFKAPSIRIWQKTINWLQE